MIDAHLEQDFDERRAEYLSHRESVMSTLAAKFQDINHIDEIATCIAFAFNNDIKGTVTLAHYLNLSQADMHAILEDEESYWEAIAHESI